MTIGTSNHTRATLAPATGERQRELTVQNTLTFKTAAAYSYTLKAKFTSHFGTARADRVNASGVTIESGSLFQLHSQVQGTMTLGITFVVIDNTSASPISGAFSNLPDGAVITVGSNHLQASYKGNTGNDLTLTVVP